MNDPTTSPTFMNRLQDWFYAKETPYALALVRILFPLALLVALIPRWFHVRELYSTDGSPTPFWWNYGSTNMLPVFSAEVAIGVYTAMIFLLVAACLGWKTRISLGVLTLLVPYFGLVDSLGTLTKYTVLAFHVFLLLSISGCGSVWSIDAWLNRKAENKSHLPQCEVWPLRLMQLLVGVVYLSSAVTKVQTHGFFTGDQMCYWVLANQNFPNPVGKWMSLYPSMLVAFGYIAATWEVLFLFTVWKDPSRKIMLSLGLLFHLMTYFMLGLFVFPLLYIGIYCCFLREQEAWRLGQFVMQLVPVRFSSRPKTSLAHNLATWPAFALLLLGMSVVSIAAERKRDVYQERGPDGPITLQPISEETIAEIMRNDQKLAVEDQIFSMEVGTFAVGGFLGNPRSQFHAGETMLMQARLLIPHNDLWLEYTLRNQVGQVIDSSSLLAPREEPRINFHIHLDPDLPGGEYELVLKTNGKRAATKRISIRSRNSP